MAALPPAELPLSCVEAVEAAAQARRCGEVGLAIRLYRQVLAIDPHAWIARNNLANSLLTLGRIREAAHHFDVAGRDSGHRAEVDSNRLVASQYDVRMAPDALSKQHAVWGSRQPITAPRKHAPRDRLRIAYLTPDFHFHPHAFVHVPHLRHYSRERFELFLYHGHAVHDEYTAQARQAALRWRDVAGKPPGEIARQIRRDRIDILIDITGHFARSPLPVFALRPAPLQVSFPGYPATTGLAAVDYKIVDHYSDPPGLTEHLYTEKLFRLDRPFACYAPPHNAPAISPLPALANGYVTFGSFNNRPKLNALIMGLWAEILSRVPNSRLLLHHTFNGERKVSRDFAGPLARFFRSCGISSRRLDFVGGVSLSDHLAVMAQADIALDTFPYHGMTTTCESLWMGVPVVSLAGNVHVSRVGVSLLSSVGLNDWIAQSPQGYVDFAVAKAEDQAGLARLRSGLRSTMADSALTDGPGFIHAIEESLAVMWNDLVAK